MLDVVKSRNIWFVASGIIIAAALLMAIFFGLNPGIDFRGGSLSEIKFEQQSPETSQIHEKIAGLDLGAVNIQKTDRGSYIIRSHELNQEQHGALKDKLTADFGNLNELKYESIGPTISGEVTRRAFYQLILVSLGILAYIAWAFRRVPRPLSSWWFGAAAIIALVHDLLIVIGVFALLGKLAQVEIDALFVTALLTVLGFSVHDTIIVFDRIRENLKKLTGETFSGVVSRSINQTLVRSINTSTTVVFVLVALLLFGGESIRYFVLALLIGVAVGTYSSIFIASPLLYVFHRKKLS
ncbi:MAG: protein-export membrane protein SecF [Candidatus Doudnabacteria bacterium RIFCSPHIGHO2_02_FULL_46_11]|uniref:Protein-export membrane protein SecF n=1 Tax=Candidatus Doudnabacteria bacterium RIFCSPHIGHO2_02_FULL_46_11 TaxID=1817832 RepID=A0A1F5P4X6_9BACT|nr:MAG: protein-export membrane protein SecF [Candidatus Doudnabacteria bacterium RIFCSPHIGHO2_02_FULL_46_11]